MALIMIQVIYVQGEGRQWLQKARQWRRSLVAPRFSVGARRQFASAVRGRFLLSVWLTSEIHHRWKPAVPAAAVAQAALIKPGGASSGSGSRGSRPGHQRNAADR